MADVFLRNKTEQFTVIPLEIMKNKEIKLTDRGMLATLISLPDNWKLSLRGLSAILPDSYDAISASCKRLEKLGYIRRTRLTDKGKVTGWLWEVSNKPEFFKPETEIPVTEKPETEIPDQSNIHQSSIQESIIHESNKQESGGQLPDAEKADCAIGRKFIAVNGQPTGEKPPDGMCGAYPGLRVPCRKAGVCPYKEHCK